MIDGFIGEYAFLSSFWPVQIEYFGLVFPSVENAFQATKTHDVEQKQRFLTVKAGKAKRMGRELVLRYDWEGVKVGVMRNLVHRKFQDVELGKLLLSTGEHELVEGNTWHDNFFGNCHCHDCKNINGQNWLGRILMEERDEIKRSMQ